VETSSSRVLVVDDSGPFRTFIGSTLGRRPELQIVGDVTDGLQAVQKAVELHPDLILFDIGMPRLNGIEAAQQIRRLSPKSKIIFVSQESSADVVQQVLSLGACGYVVKMDAARELLPAIDAVLRGEQFVGSRFAGQDFSGASDIAASDEGASEGFRSKAVASLHRDEGVTRRHEAHFYSDEACLLDRITQFIGAALMAGNSTIVLATEPHRAALLPRLQAHGLEVDVAIEQGRYIALDAAETLSIFMINGMPDSVRFLKAFDDLIATAAGVAKGEHSAQVAVFGECVSLLWAQGNAEAAIRMEQLGNEVALRHDIDILCAYPLGSLQGGMDTHIFQQICAEHSAVFSQ
jgi:DNA-binding NarL/FixJ family response regulator